MKLLHKIFKTTIWLCILSLAVPVNAGAISDFFSESDIQLYNPNDCPPEQTNPSTDSSTNTNVCCSNPTSQSLTSGKDNEEKIWNFFIAKGLSPEQTAGIMGNMSQESGFEPTRAQSGGKRNVDDPSVFGTAVGVGKAWGLIQWDAGGRAIEYAKQAKITTPINQLDTQLNIIWWHTENTTPTGRQNILPEFKKSKTAREAASSWEHLMEGAGTPVMANRWAAADAALKKYGAATTAPVAPDDSVDSNNYTCTCNNPASPDSINSDNLTQKLGELAQQNGGKTAISVSSVNSDTSGNANGSTKMPTRSSYKIYVAYATLRAIEDKKIDWGDRVWGSKNVEQTMEAMIVNSDNSAADALRLNSDTGGPDTITSLLRNDVKLSSKTVIGSGNSSSPAGTGSQSTTNDFVKFLKLLAKRELPGVNEERSYDTIVGYMKRATTDGTSARDGIAKGAEGTEVADKPGWAPSGVDQASNDVGIVFLNNTPYVIAILTDKPNQWDGIAKIARDVHTLMGGVSSANCGGVTSGSFSEVIKSYAWPEYHPPQYIKRQPAWAKVADDPKSHYIGGAVRGVKGIDCGGFVTTTMRNSGIDPNYNPGKGPTGSPVDQNSQWGYLDKTWEKLTVNSTRDLEPGDVAINSSHTFMYVGEIDGFDDVFASASFSSDGTGGRAPMAGQGDAMTGNYTWYRKK